MLQKVGLITCPAEASSVVTRVCQVACCRVYCAAPVTARCNAMSQPRIGSRVANGRANVAVVACGLFSMDSSISRLTMRWLTTRAILPKMWKVTTMHVNTAIWVPIVSCRSKAVQETSAASPLTSQSHRAESDAIAITLKA